MGDHSALDFCVFKSSRMALSKLKPTRERKHKRRRNEDAYSASNGEAAELPGAEQRIKLKQELLRNRSSTSKISSKKQKRLDKYIDNKLRKDENLELLKRLSQEHAAATFDRTALQSSRALGKRKHDQFAADLRDQDESGISEDDSSDISSDDATAQRPAPLAHTSKSSMPVPPTRTPQIAQGSGLKQPLNLGSDGLPVLKVRERKYKLPNQLVEAIAEELPWEGFSSGSEAGNLDASSDSEILSDESLEDGEEETGESDLELETDEASSEDEDSEGDDLDNQSSVRPKLRQSAFKSWATQRINDSLGFTPTNAVEDFAQREQLSKPTVATPMMKKVDVTLPEGKMTRKAFTVSVNRPAETQEARMKLPIVAEEQKIMEAIHNNSSIIVWGATGSGKTTQLPQFLFEAGYGHKDSSTPGLIGVTQPRRVAAVSMAKRVGDELAEHGDKVSYQVRFDSTASRNTAIKFMTDGILLREISQDFALLKYSIIVVDEAHERSVNTDILIGMLTRIVDLRKKMSREDIAVKPLQLVIMSATLRLSDFLQNGTLFRGPPPPFVEAEGRQHPVTAHFSRRTERDYVEQALRKVVKGHRKLPPGGMLVFLTGQNEIKDLIKRLSAALKSSKGEIAESPKVHITASEAPLESEDLELGPYDNNETQDDYDEEIDFVGLDDNADDGEFDIEDENDKPRTEAVHLLPLHSQMPTREQLRVFEPPPEGSRLIVLATNVAETSLTIPGIRYVFDCGRSKQRVYDPDTGVQRFQIDWISKASAEQRAGRAGRTGPGHCYRLYSSAMYESDFADHTEPEILRTPLESVVLQLKAMGIHNVLKFPFPTLPDKMMLAKAEKLLRNLGALGSDMRVTPLGKSLSIYPLSPRYGKMLAIGSQHGCLPYVIAMVSGFAVGDVFIPENQLDLGPVETPEEEIYTNEKRLEDDAREQKRKAYNHAQAMLTRQDRTSDALKMLSAICSVGYANDLEKFCDKMFLRPKAMKEALQLREQLSAIVKANHPNILGAFQSRLPVASAVQLRALKQMVAAGFIDQVAIRADLSPNPPVMLRKPRRAIDVPYLTLFPSHFGKAADSDDKAVYIHPSSVLSRTSPKDLPQFLVFSHLQQAVAATVGNSKTPKIRMFPLTEVSGRELAALGHDTPLIQYGKPIGKIETLAGIPEKRQCWIVPSMVGEPGSIGWPFPAKKAVQVKDPKSGWVIEKFLT